MTGRRGVEFKQAAQAIAAPNAPMVDVACQPRA
jgi:hypothetical protein